MKMGFRAAMLVLLSAVVLCGHLAEGLTKLSELSRSMIVNAVAANGTKAGSGNITVSWMLNTTAMSVEAASAYKTVNIKLCFGKISQVDRAWRKTNDLLSKDKTCLFDIGSQPFTPSGNNITWTVTKDVPFAHYFVRVYVTNAAKEKIAYGQTVDAKQTNLFTIDPITGRHASLDIAAAVFSAFAVISLFVFYFLEKKASKKGK